MTQAVAGKASNIRWRLEGGNRLIVEQGATLAVRLFSLPFLALGSYILFQFLEGLRHHDLTIPGAVALPLFGAAFAIPGFIMAFGNKRTVVDKLRRHVEEYSGYGFMGRRTITAIPGGAQVSLYRELRHVKDNTTRGHDVTYVYYPVEVAAAGHRGAVLALVDETGEQQALALATDAAALLGVELCDRRAENVESVDETGYEEGDE